MEPSLNPSTSQRIGRLLRAGLHVFGAVLRIFILFPWLTTRQRRNQIRRWSRQALAIFNLHLVYETGLDRGTGSPCLYVGNHVSWLDIFAIWATTHTQFVAKSEVARWPVIGMLARRLGVIFIDRTKQGDALTVGHTITSELSNGNPVCIFPEGTTTEGHGLNPFRPALFQPAVASRVSVQPLAIRYSHADGTIATEAAYTGDMSLLHSMWRLAGSDPLTIEITFLQALSPSGLDRRQLAKACYHAVSQRLADPAPPLVPPIEQDATSLIRDSNGVQQPS